MPTRIQALGIGLGINKQTDIATLAGSPTFMKIRKLDTGFYTDDYQTEDDADEIGKGTEFISQGGVFPVQYDFMGDINKYGSAEFTAWAWAYALGNVAYASATYTITPINPATTIELPYFPIVQQLSEGGSSAVDELHYGCMIDSVTTSFQSGTGRKSVSTNCRFHGSGKLLTPSAIVLPSSVQTEKYMLAPSMSATIIGTDYVAAKTLVNGSMSWNNNPLLDDGYFPGSGTQNNASIRGRIECGARRPAFSFEVRMKNNSPEYAALLAQTSGTVVITLTYDSTHYVTWTWQRVSYKSVTRGEHNGIATVRVTAAIQEDSTNGVLTITSKNGLVGIAA